MSSPYLNQPVRSQTEAFRAMIADRERNLSRSTDPHQQARLRREIEALKGNAASEQDAPNADRDDTTPNTTIFSS